METEVVTDLYQASYYVLNGGEVVAIECIPSGMATSCRIMMEGENLTTWSQTWYAKQAAANLTAFRQAYNQVYTLCQQAKRNYSASTDDRQPHTRGRGRS